MKLGWRPRSRHSAWISLFSCWLLLLTGVFASFFGPPGVLQALRLDRLLGSKKAQLNQIQTELQRLEKESHLLSHNRFAQEREVRKTLGYASSKELIFDFSTSD